MLDYSETSENVYLTFNQHIELKNKKFEILVHLTFKTTSNLQPKFTDALVFLMILHNWKNWFFIITQARDFFQKEYISANKSSGTTKVNHFWSLLINYVPDLCNGTADIHFHVWQNLRTLFLLAIINGARKPWKQMFDLQKHEHWDSENTSNMSFLYNEQLSDGRSRQR